MGLHEVTMEAILILIVKKNTLTRFQEKRSPHASGGGRAGASAP
jgi:hypothetical protein